MNRIVFKYPDGTYSYAFKSDLHEGWMEVRPRKERMQNRKNPDVNVFLQNERMSEGSLVS